MFTLFTLVAQVLANAHKLTDADSWRAFLKEHILFIRTRAKDTDPQLNDVRLNDIEFVLNDDGLFEYAYGRIVDQCQTPEILVESADEDAIIGLVEKATENNPEVVDPVVIVSLITQIISVINAIKALRNR